MRVNKFVLDTNIWVSYLINFDIRKIAYYVGEKEITIYYCKELLTEIDRVLNYSHLEKYGIKSKQAISHIKELGVEFELVKPIKNYLPTDPDDDYIIALALQTNSGYVTSGDRDILSQKKQLEKKFKKLRIITKTEFEKMFN